MESIQSPAISEPSAARPRRQRSFRERVELVSVVLITVSGGISAYAGFQAALWDGEQSSNYNRGGARRVESTRLSELGNQQKAVDVSLFAAWLAAVADRKPVLQEFYRNRFRPEFSRAFEEWMAEDPIHNDQATASPFSLPSYQVLADRKAAALTEEAKAFGEAGDRANQHSDRYTMATVLLALVLVLAGLAPQFRVRSLQLVLLAFSVVLLSAAIGAIATLPLARLD
jgi:hypothetical protein